eukprot:CAMPEP_0181212900 /NCGR_PEP_ID=MMETSP1096-20121128/24611_1 /TAXON_ID=156174 ORGANISM="Chrysochromulina ericina, Strain CCMP281" /NCGR_SAMPLE_ID=MMETSP1096 /ASSEMBLY_ACC=CAM_ASM_000453 /LENGTH=108 /DNA_ID=CAMNT_0023304489 /DNA_START=312 /DNA_END=639 /DNA_ORIENTATION=+
MPASPVHAPLLQRTARHAIHVLAGSMCSPAQWLRMLSVAQWFRKSVVPHALPHCRIALEAGAEGNLPDTISLPQPALGDVGGGTALAMDSALVAILGDELELVPDRRR